MTIEIIRASAELRLAGKSYEGCPLVLRDGSLDFVPSRWLAWLWNTSCPHTARTYARQIVPFFLYLEARKYAWWEVNSDDVEAFQTRLQLAGYEPSTANLSLQAIGNFYRWCKTKGFILRVPFINSVSSKAWIQSAPPQVRPLRQLDRVAKIISQRDYERVLAAIPADADDVVFRTELTFECGRYMGLRRQEVAGLTCAAFDVIADGDTPVGLLHLDSSITKGSRERDVLAPRQLLRRIARYRRVHRTQTILEARDRCRRYKEPPQLFLTRWGKPLSPEYISASWNTAAGLAGVAARFHSNRHWFGTIVVAAARRLKLADPLREAANLLGHVNIETTKIYDHSISLLEPADYDTGLMELAWSYNDTRS